MAEIKYLVTVDDETSETLKIELVGDAGDLTEVALEEFQLPAAAAAPYAVNIYIGGGQPRVRVEETGRQRARRLAIPHDPTFGRRGMPRHRSCPPEEDEEGED